MAADCWLCRRAVPAVRNAIGTLDHPIGLCQKCSSLCCGHHGHRDSAPAFLCILCDASLQAASAGWSYWVSQGGLSTLLSGAPAPSFPAPAGAGLAAALVALCPPGDPLAPALVRSLHDWMRGRSGYGYLPDAIWRLAQELVTLLDNLVSERQRFDYGDRPEPDGDDEVAAFWRSLDENGRLLLAAAIVLIRLLEADPADLPAPLRAVVEFAAPIELERLEMWRSDLLERTGDDESDR